MKKTIGLFLALLILLSIPIPAFAETIQSRAVIGADLELQQIEAIYGVFGVRRGDVIELSMTNADERE